MLLLFALLAVIFGSVVRVLFCGSCFALSCFISVFLFDCFCFSYSETMVRMCMMVMVVMSVFLL